MHLNKACAYIHDCRGCRIASVSDAGYGRHNAEKLAQLITAAPDLLDILRSLVNGPVRMSDKSNCHLSEHDANVINARAIIAKIITEPS